VAVAVVIREEEDGMNKKLQHSGGSNHG